MVSGITKEFHSFRADGILDLACSVYQLTGWLSGLTNRVVPRRLRFVDLFRFQKPNSSPSLCSSDSEHSSKLSHQEKNHET